MTPGSMPVAREIYQEGLIIPPVKLVHAGQMDEDLFALILANVRTPQERAGDLWAQIAANQRGAERLLELAARYGVDEVDDAEEQLLAYTERMTRALIASPAGGLLLLHRFSRRRRRESRARADHGDGNDRR